MARLTWHIELVEFVQSQVNQPTKYSTTLNRHFHGNFSAVEVSDSLKNAA